MPQYKHEKEEKSRDPLDPQEVFSIHESELKGWTQCKMGEHKWEKLNDTELKCKNCETAIIVGIDDMEDLLKG